MKKILIALPLTIVLAGFANNAIAQPVVGFFFNANNKLQNDLKNNYTNSPADSSIPRKWQFLLEPYMMFPNMNGTVGLGALPDADVNENPGDIFSNLQIGAMLYGEAYSKFWAISSDLTYMRLSAGVAGKYEILSGDATVEQLAWELAVLRKLKPWLEAGLALQLNSIQSDLNIAVNGGQSYNSNLTETWVDPSVVARIKVPKNKWLFQFRGNIGGFGIGSDFYWQTQLYAGYRFSKLFELSAGYRAIGIDYQKGSDKDRFLYDMNTFGLVIRLGFHI